MLMCFVVVTTELTQRVVRRPESVGTVQICVLKDLQTANVFEVTIQTFDGTAMSECCANPPGDIQQLQLKHILL